MRFEPSTRFHSSSFRPAAALGATLAAGMLLVSCDADSLDEDTSWFDDLFSSDSDDDDDEDTAAPDDTEDEDTDDGDTDDGDTDDGDTDDGGDEGEGTADDAEDDDESWWEGLFGDEEDDDEEDDDEDTDDEGTADDAEDDDESWWEGLFGGDDEDDDEDDGDTDDEDTEEEESLALPASCTEAGAEQVAAGLTPQGTVLEESSGEVAGATDAEQLSCTWTGAGDETGAETFALVFTDGTDPGARLDVAQPSDEDEMNWEVDIDVDLDNYRTPAADALGGELDYVRTVEGSTQSLHLSLPDDFYVSAISVASEAAQEDLEQAVLDAAERMEE